MKEKIEDKQKNIKEVKNGEKMKEKIGKYTLYIFLFIIVFIISLIYLDSSPLYPNMFPDRDSSVFQVMGKGLLENKILYKDLFDHKGPVIYIINAIALLISEKYGLFIIEVIIAYIGTTFIYKTARIMLNKYFSMIMSIIYTFISFEYFRGGNFTEEYAITFISIAMYYIIKILHSKENNKLNWIMIGTTFAITFFIKPTYCAIWAVFGVVQLICSIKDKKIKELIKAIGYMLFGILIISIPIIIYLVVNGAMDSFIDAYFLMNIKYSKSTILQKIKGLLQLFLGYKYDIYLVIMIISNFIMLISKKINKRTKVFVTLFFIISTILTGWSPTAYFHYLIQLAPCFTLEIIIATYIINKTVKEKDLMNYKIIKKLPLKCIYIIIPICIMIPIRTKLVSLTNFMKFKDLYYEDRINVVSEIKDYINDEDEILVLGNKSYYYLLFDKIPDCKYFFQLPIMKYDPKIKDETEKYITQKKPKVIINEMYEYYETYENDILQELYGKKVLEEILNNYEEIYTCPIKYNDIIKYYVLKEE